MVICMSCRRRCDPNRSFCSNCGSSVFIDTTTEGSRQSLDVEASTAEESAARRPNPPTRRMRPPVARPGRPAVDGSSLASLIKFGIFLFIAYRLAGFLLGIPEIRTLVDQVQRGETPNIESALESLQQTVATTIQRAIGAATAPSPSDDDVVPTPSDLERLERENPEQGQAAKDAAAAVAEAIGGNTPPRAVTRVAPVYTQEALKAKVEGAVLLRATVNTDGTVSEVAVIRSLDREHGLDRQAVAALQKWVFEPGRRNGQPTRTSVQVELSFSLP